MARKAKKSKQVFKLPVSWPGLLTSVSRLSLEMLLPPPATARDRVHYYKTGRDGERVVVDLETGDALPG